jgi:hypothetical protein
VATLASDSLKAPSRGVERLLTELGEAWNILAEINRRQLIASTEIRQHNDWSDTLAETNERYERETRLLLIEPAEQFARLRPLRRSLEAMQEFDRDATGAALRARLAIDTRFQLLLSESALDLCEPWRIRRSSGTKQEWSVWEKRLVQRSKRAAELLVAYGKWAGKAAHKKGEPKDKERKQRVELWWRRQTAVTRMHDMEVAFRDLGLIWLTNAKNLTEGLRHERERVLFLAERMVEWLRDGSDNRTAAPVESMLLAACDERLRGWFGVVEQEADNRLPESAEIITLGRPAGFRAMRTRAAFLSALQTFSKPAMGQAVRGYWDGTAKVVREAGRAQEMLDYWSKAAREGGDDRDALLEQARNNAASVLTEQLRTTATDDTLEPKFVETFRTWVREGSTVLEAAQVGWVELLRMPRGRRLSHTVFREGRRRSRASLEHAAHWASHRWERGLETLGGRLPTQPAITPVVTRSTLRDTLALPAAKNELPAIYSSLFRLAPIEDRRFLVGRDRELTGLEQALKDWDSGRFAACIFVGARGSGKTSLLNCAASGAFAGREVIRTQFGERMISVEAIDDFLCHVLELPARADLDSAFKSKRRILMIEEGERIYLRKVGGFEAAEHLMRRIQRTASTTLWVLAMNDKAFRVLSAGAQFSRAFSHRINAMSVSREDLENAILERHRLSGLRLEFAPPPASDPRVSRIKNWLGLETSPQKLYFDSLYQQSGGVFRSAFELWSSSIERVEGETLKIRQPLEPAFARLRNELTQDDLFTLLIIQEHGSLTHQETAEVLYEDLEASRTRMDRLVALGLIETDPEHPGLRVRPEAYRFTSDALERVNLV